MSLMAKTITIEIPDWMDETLVKKIIEDYLKNHGNLNLILSLRGSKIDVKVLKEIDEMFEEWKQSLTHP